MNNICRYICIGLVQISSLCIAQSRVDSLENILDRTEVGRERIKILNQLSEALLEIDLDRSLQYGLQANELLKKDGSLKDEGINKHNLSIIHQRKGNYQEAIDWSLAGIENVSGFEKGDEIEAMKLSAQFNRNIASTYRRMGNYEEALKYNQQAVNLYDSVISISPGDPEIQGDLARTLMALGIVHSSIANYDISTDYYLKALKIAEDNDLQTNATFINFNLASQLLSRAKNDSALLYFQRVLVLVDSLDIARLRGSVYHNLGVTYKNLGQFENSLDYLQRALMLADQKGEKEEVAHLNGIIGGVLIDMERFEDAEGHLNEALVKTNVDMNAKLTLYLYRWQLYEKTGRYVEALEALKTYRELEDSVLNNERDKRYAELEAKYQTAKKEKELAQQASQIFQLESENKTKRMWSYILGISLFAIIAVAIVIIRNQKQKIRVTQELGRTKVENATLRERELQQQLELKNKELTSYTVNFIQKNELFNELKSLVDGIMDSGDGTAKNDLLKLRRTIMQNANQDKYWEDFRLHFDNVHNDFFRRLKEDHPDLTGNDLKLCALAKLNLNLKESSVILGISPESVKIARYRLRKKLGLEQEVPLIDYLFNYN